MPVKASVRRLLTPCLSHQPSGKRRLDTWASAGFSATATFAQAMLNTKRHRVTLSRTMTTRDTIASDDCSIDARWDFARDILLPLLFAYYVLVLLAGCICARHQESQFMQLRRYLGSGHVLQSPCSDLSLSSASVLPRHTETSRSRGWCASCCSTPPQWPSA